MRDFDSFTAAPLPPQDPEDDLVHLAYCLFVFLLSSGRPGSKSCALMLLCLVVSCRSKVLGQSSRSDE